MPYFKANMDKIRFRPPSWIEGAASRQGGEGRGGEGSYQLFCPPTFRMLPPPMLIIQRSFTPGSKPTFLTNSYHLMLLLPAGLPRRTGLIMHIILCLFSHLNLLFIPCGRLSWLPVSFLLHVKYTLSYRIVSQWPSVTSNLDFMVTVLFNVKYLENGAR